jgi:hypothetical protein
VVIPTRPGQAGEETEGCECRVEQVEMMAEYQNQCYHKSDVLVKVQFQVIEKEEDRLRDGRKWGVGGQKKG